MSLIWKIDAPIVSYSETSVNWCFRFVVSGAETTSQNERMKIGDTIKAERQRRGWSIDTLVEKLGDIKGGDRASLSKIENNQRWPRPSVLDAIAGAFNIKVYQLFALAEGIAFPLSIDLPHRAGGSSVHNAENDKTTQAAHEDRKEYIPPDTPVFQADLKFVLDLNRLLAEVHASQSRALQFVFFSIAKQLDGARLLTDLRSAKERANADPQDNRLLRELLDNLIEQLMRSALDEGSQKK